METALQKAISKIEKLYNEVDRLDGAYYEGREDAFGEAIDILESLIPADKEQIEDAFWAGKADKIDPNYYYDKTYQSK